MIQKTFKRYEKKYLLSPQQYRTVRQGIQERMQLDQYGLYTICSIYFDTDNFQLIRSSLEKPVYKEKLRLRSYAQASDEKPVFVELKKKYESVVYKRRITCPQRAASEAISSGSRYSSRISSSACSATALPWLRRILRSLWRAIRQSSSSSCSRMID